MKPITLGFSQKNTVDTTNISVDISARKANELIRIVDYATPFSLKRMEAVIKQTIKKKLREKVDK